MKKKKGLSALDLFTIGFGSIVGVGWAVSINTWMSGSGGPFPAAMGYIGVLIMMIPIGFCYCELTQMIPVAGGGMAFTYKGFGEKLSFISGWATFGAFLTIIPWEAINVTNILAMLFPVLKTGTPLYTLAGTDIYLQTILLGIFFSFVLYSINKKGAAYSAGIQKILCFVLMGASLIAIIFSLAKLDLSNLQPLYENVGRGNHKSFFGGAFAIILSAPFFLAGFDTIPQTIEETDGNKSAVGKAVIFSIVFACLFYAILLFSLGSAMPWKEFYKLNTPAVSEMMKIIYPGTTGIVLYYVILIGAISGLFTVWNGFMMATPRMLMSIGRAKLIPSKFAELHEEYKTPVFAMKFCLVVSITGPFLGMGLINDLTCFSGTAFMLSWLLTAMSAFKLRFTEPDIKRPYKMPGGKIMAGFASILTGIVFILMFVPASPAFMGSLSLEMFLGWMGLGFLLFLANSKERNRFTPEERSASLFASMKK